MERQVMFKLIRRSSGNIGFLRPGSSNVTSEFSLGQHKLHYTDATLKGEPPRPLGRRLLVKKELLVG